MAQQVAAGPVVVEVMDEMRLRPLAVFGDNAGHLGDGTAIAGDRIDERDDAGLALTLKHAIDRALAVLDDGARGERRAVPADTDKASRQ